MKFYTCQEVCFVVVSILLFFRLSKNDTTCCWERVWVCPLLTSFCVMDNAFWLAEKLEQFKSRTCCKRCMKFLYIKRNFKLSRISWNSHDSCQLIIQNLFLLHTLFFSHLLRMKFYFNLFSAPKKKNFTVPQSKQFESFRSRRNNICFYFIFLRSLLCFICQSFAWPMGILMWDILIGVNLILFNCQLLFDLLA